MRTKLSASYYILTHLAGVYSLEIDSINLPNSLIVLNKITCELMEDMGVKMEAY